MLDINHFKKLTKNIQEYTADEIDKFKFMSDEELEQYQYDLDFDTGNLSNWDDIRAFYTLKNKVESLQQQLNAKVMFVSNGMEEEQYVLQEKVIQFEQAIKGIEQLSNGIKSEIEVEGNVNFEDLGWKQVLVTEYQAYQKCLNLLKG